MKSCHVSYSTRRKKERKKEEERKKKKEKKLRPMSGAPPAGWPAGPAIAAADAEKTDGRRKSGKKRDRDIELWISFLPHFFSSLFSSLLDECACVCVCVCVCVFVRIFYMHAWNWRGVLVCVCVYECALLSQTHAFYSVCSG